MTGRLLTAVQVAEQLGLSAETILRWTRAGKLPAVRLSRGSIRYPQAALDAWLADRATPAREALTVPTDAATGERYPAPVGLSALTVPPRQSAAIKTEE